MEIKFYGDEERSFFTVQDVKEYLFSQYEGFETLPTAEGLSVRVDGLHVGNVKPCYPTEAKVKELQKLF